MQSSIAQRLGSAARFTGSLVLTATAGLLTWFFYQQYLDQQNYHRISVTGKRVSVVTTDVSHEQRTWTDAFMNVVYLSFNYQQKPYTLRYKQDSTWLSAGDRVELYYDASRDVFRQPKAYTTTQGNSRQSRLIGFTFLHQWSHERKWLAATIALGAIFTLLLCGVLATVTHVEWVRAAGRLVFIALLLTGVVYLGYNTWRYYQYYHQLKAGAREETVQVLSTGRHTISRRSSWFYTYQATILHHQQERIIPIEAVEYNRLKPGDPLQVYYNPAVDDMMSVNHTPDHTNLAAALFAGLLLVLFSWRPVQQWSNRRA